MLIVIDHWSAGIPETDSFQRRGLGANEVAPHNGRKVVQEALEPTDSTVLQILQFVRQSVVVLGRVSPSDHRGQLATKRLPVAQSNRLNIGAVLDSLPHFDQPDVVHHGNVLLKKTWVDHERLGVQKNAAHAQRIAPHDYLQIFRPAIKK